MSADLYDRIPYDSRAVSHASLFRLATSALLRGIEAAPPTDCRVLELGCADATHLLPLALAYPESHFVGVDRSKEHLERGRAVAEELGIENLELVHADIAELEPGLGPFDYFICHGVFSWISDEARKSVLRLMSSELSPRGLAYLSYNTLPGWGLRGPLRDLLVERTRHIEDPLEKVAAAREHLRLLKRLRAGGEHDPYAELLAQIIEGLLARSDSYLVHEYLAEHNRAFAVGEVVDALETHGLKMIRDLLPATVTRATQDQIEVELYRADLPRREVDAATDLLTFRQLRASLICRAEVAERAPSPSALYESCEIAAPLRPVDPGPWGVDVEQRFEAPGGATVAAKTPLLRAALILLGEVWPASRAFGPLLERAASLVQAHMAEPPTLEAKDAEEAFFDLLRLRAHGFVELRAHAPRVITQVSATPSVSALTRLDAARGRPVTNQLHEPVVLEAPIAAVVSLLDGTRDRAAIEAALVERAGLGPDGERPSAEALDELVRGSLRALASHALLRG